MSAMLSTEALYQVPCGAVHTASTERVELLAVVPQELLLELVAQRKLQHAVEREGPLRVGVREVGREHDVVVEIERLDALGRRLVGFDRDVALAPEVLRRL